MDFGVGWGLGLFGADGGKEEERERKREMKSEE